MYLGQLARVIKPSAVNEEPRVDQLVPSILPWNTTVALVIPDTWKNTGWPPSTWTAADAPVAVTAFSRVLAADNELMVFPY
jgi:hypothetical protein